MQKTMWAVILLLAMLSSASFGQVAQPRGEFAGVPLLMDADKLPEFEVADIQVSRVNGQARAQFLPGGRVQFQSLPLKLIVLAAWGRENDDGRVTGGDSWVNSAKFDIVAKAPPDSTIVTLRLMLRSLLIKRFGLQTHISEEILPVFALEKGKGSPKMTLSAKNGQADCKRSLENGAVTMTCSNMTMDELANGLRAMAPAYVNKPVVNLTSLEGQYDFKLAWKPRGQLLGTNEGRNGDSDGSARHDSGVLGASDPTAAGMTVFESVDKNLGSSSRRQSTPCPSWSSTE